MMASTLLAFNHDTNEQQEPQNQQEQGEQEQILDNTTTTTTTAKIQSFCFPHIQIVGLIDSQISSRTKKAKALQSIFKQMKHDLDHSFHSNRVGYSIVMEQLSFGMNKLCIASGYSITLQSMLATRKRNTTSNNHNNNNKPLSFNKNIWTIAMAPARVDLSGGWSDTPPICYEELGGSVTGVAVLLNDLMPLSCRSRIIIRDGQNNGGILLRSENREPIYGSLVNSTEVEVLDMNCLQSYRNPLSNCALLKCALICMGIITEEDILLSGGCDDDDDVGVPSLQTLLDRYFSSSSSSDNNNEHVRLEIVTTSLLPQGSGMGTSSILAACALSSISQCAGFGQPDEGFLLHGVLMLEQLLTSGGGWQDQTHGIVPGFKTARSIASQLPLDLSIERLNMERRFVVQLEERMVLIFTGKTRLAKNIVQDVQRRWSWQTNEIVTTMSRNVQLSEQCRLALLDGDIETLSNCLNEYCQIKLQMTGEDSGAIPESCALLMKELKQRNIITGACLCGAGGGGFMIVITSTGVDLERMNQVLKDLVPQHNEISTFEVYKCRIADNGLVTKTICTTTNNNNSSTENNATDVYNLQWQRRSSSKMET